MANERRNGSQLARIKMDVPPFATGTFKNVYLGYYTRGPRKDEPCVGKVFKDGSPYETEYFEQELRVVARAQKMLDAWSNARITESRILLNRPERWWRVRREGNALVEPMVHGFEKLNSNTGWAESSSNPWSEVMQALSHFSYHYSNGELILCDLQGAAHNDEYILCDPAIISTHQSYGPADLGPKGINDWFLKHKCGKYCNKNWRKPKQALPRTFDLRRGTTMVKPVATREAPGYGFNENVGVDTTGMTARATREAFGDSLISGNFSEGGFTGSSPAYPWTSSLGDMSVDGHFGDTADWTGSFSGNAHPDQSRAYHSLRGPFTQPSHHDALLQLLSTRPTSPTATRSTVRPRTPTSTALTVPQPPTAVRDRHRHTTSSVLPSVQDRRSRADHKSEDPGKKTAYRTDTRRR
ncbi:kinase-like domain-containing protein [Xylariaceae sp. FL0255]|nr:kinase-like domain-containing protein [Xylariaceae sp. FL0255]